MKKILFTLAALVSTSFVAMADDDRSAVTVEVTESPASIGGGYRSKNHHKMTKEQTLKALKNILSEAEDAAKGIHGDKFKEAAEYHIATIKHAIETLEKPSFDDKDKDFFRDFTTESQHALKRVKNIKAKDAKHSKHSAKEEPKKEEHHKDAEHDKKGHDKKAKKKNKDHKDEHKDEHKGHGKKDDKEDVKGDDAHKDEHKDHEKKDHKKDHKEDVKGSDAHKDEHKDHEKKDHKKDEHKDHEKKD